MRSIGDSDSLSVGGEAYVVKPDELRESDNMMQCKSDVKDIYKQLYVVTLILKINSQVQMYR